MILTESCQNDRGNKSLKAKTWMIMKLTVVLLLFFTFQVSANDGYAQKITIVKTNVHLTEIFKSIEQQTGYHFFYDRVLLKNTHPIDIAIRSATLDQALSECLKGQSLTYSVVKNTVVIRAERVMNIQAQTISAHIEMPMPPPVEIRGRIVNQQGEPLQNVSVLIAGTKIGTTTDSDGRFSITAPDNVNVILEVSSVGFQAKKVNVGNQREVNVVLDVDVAGLSDVVVVGYGSQKKQNLTASVVTVGEDEIRPSPAANAIARLQGRVAGVSIVTDNSPGGDVSVRVRGFGSINNNEPLYVIDGVPTTGGLTRINPNDIESMTVLKDASSSAIYGSRAANGVIIITTKRGKPGESKATLAIRGGVQRATNQLNLLNTKEYGELEWLMYKNNGLKVGDLGWGNPQYGYGATPVIPDYIFPAGKMEGEVDESTYSYPNPYNGITKANKNGTNWYDLIFVPAPIQEYNLGMSGGSNKSNYAFSVGYMDQKGIVDYTGFKRYSLRSNAGVKLAGWLEVGESLGVAYTHRNSFGNNSEGNPISYAQNLQPIVPVYDIKGNFAGTKAPLTGEAQNPLAALIRAKDNYTNQIRILASPYAQIKITKDFTFKSLLGVDYNSSRGKSRSLRNPEFTLAQSSDILSESYSGGIQYNWANTLNYNKAIKNHNINMLIGTEEVNSNTESLSAGRSTFAFSDLDYMVLNAGEGNILNGGAFDQWTTFSYFGRLNYNYQGKYLLEGVVRRDGSSRFSKQNRWGTFPALSAGWRISKEAFMKNINWITELKLRAGWGKNGNDNVGNYNSYSTFRSDINESYYNISGGNSTSSQAGFHRYKLGNPDGRWESTTTIDIGVDATMFNSKLEFSFDLFRRITNGMLYQDSKPASWGLLQLPSINIGEMENKGFDLMLGYHSSLGKDLSYNLQANFSHYKNEVIKLNNNSNEIIYGDLLRLQSYTATQAGYPISSFYGYIAEGIYNTQEEVKDGPKYNPDINGNDVYSKPGVIKYKDISGPDGKPDGKITSADRTFIGSPQPDLSLGLNLGLQYKNWDMSMFFYGVTGNKIVNYQNRWSLFDLLSANRGKKRLYESWTPERFASGAKITVPIATNGNDDIIMQQPSTFFVEDGSYFRMKNMEIGYTFFPSKLKNKNLRVYLQATNLFTITNYSGLDPELMSGNDRQLGVDAGIYPTSQVFMLGINFNL